MTISALYAWPDYDENDKWDGASMLGTYQGEAMAVVLKSRHHDAFLRLALAAPELLEVAYLLLEMANAPNPMGQVEIKHQAIALAKSAILKAQGG
jgi:hypothetical protein